MVSRILIIASVFPPENVTSAILNYDLASRLSCEYEVTVLRPSPSRSVCVGRSVREEGRRPTFTEIELQSIVHPEASFWGRMRESVSFGRACVRYINSNLDKIDLIYNHSWHLFGYYLVSRASHKNGIPYILPVQDVYPESLFTGRAVPKIIVKTVLPFLRWIDRYSQSHASYIRTISKEMRDYLSETRHIPIERFFVVNNWQDKNAYSGYRPYVKKSGETTFVYAGSINNHANVESIIRAFSLASLQSAKLMIYGSGTNKEECVRLVKELGLNSIVFGEVDRPEVPLVQSKADVLVMSLSPGNGAFCVPSKLTSYMLSGRAILASVDPDCTAARFIKEANCGIVVPPDDLESFANAFKLCAMLDSLSLRDMGLNGRRYAERFLSPEVNLDIIISIIKSI